MLIREAEVSDLNKLQDLYLHLMDNKKIPYSLELQGLFEKIVQDPNYHILVGEIEDKIVSSITLIIIPNITRETRSYAIIENVVTHTTLRKRGLATLLLEEAIRIAKANNCYKIMLLTSSQAEYTHKFYEYSGFNKKDNVGFIKMID